MKQTFLLVLALTILWLLLSGQYVPLILSFGVVSIAFVTWISRRMQVVDGESYPFGLIPRLSTYWLWLLREIFLSNIDTARRALGPRRGVRPVVFDVPASQQTDLGLVIHANSLTLTPGTVSLEIYRGTIRAHALHPDVAAETLASSMNRRVPD